MQDAYSGWMLCNWLFCYKESASRLFRFPGDGDTGGFGPEQHQRRGFLRFFRKPGSRVAEDLEEVEPCFAKESVDALADGWVIAVGGQICQGFEFGLEANGEFLNSLDTVGLLANAEIQSPAGGMEVTGDVLKGEFGIGRVFQLGYGALGAGHLFRDIRLGHAGGSTGADECIDDDRALDAAIEFTD